MNKEVHTIIANLDGCIGMFDYLLTPKESNLLVSCIEELQQENKHLDEVNCKLRKTNEQLKDNWNKLKEYANKMHEYFLYTDVNEIYKQSMKPDNQFPNLFNLSELNASDRVLNSICKKIQELEQGNDNK